MDIILSILMLAGFGLCAGAIVMWRKGQRQRALLMITAAAVMFVNVAIWLLPTKDGVSPAKSLQST